MESDSNYRLKVVCPYAGKHVSKLKKFPESVTEISRSQEWEGRAYVQYACTSLHSTPHTQDQGSGPSQYGQTDNLQI